MSGGRHDASCLGVAHAEDVGERAARAPPRLVLDVLEHVKAPHEPSVVVERFCRILRDYRISKVVGDRYGAEWVVSAFKDRGIAYEASELDKSSIYMEVLAPFAEKRVTLIDDKRLITELRMLERKPRTGGKADVVDHAPNMHDDAANACCGALWLAGVKRGGSVFETGLPDIAKAMGGIRLNIRFRAAVGFHFEGRSQVSPANHHLSYLIVCVGEFCTTVALHEAGHAVAARSYGVRAETNLYMEGLALGGRTDYWDDLTGHQFRIVALAGAAAVACWHRPDVTAEQLIEEGWTPVPGTPRTPVITVPATWSSVCRSCARAGVRSRPRRSFCYRVCWGLASDSPQHRYPARLRGARTAQPAEDARRNPGRRARAGGAGSRRLRDRTGL